MELTVTWVNATRVGQEKRRVEEAYQERLIELFGSASNAFNSKHQWHAYHEPVMHPWQLNNIQSHVEACKTLTPSEKHLAHFIVKFFDL